MHGDRDADQDPERLFHTERDPDTHSFRKGVEGHDSNDEKRLPRIRTSERPEVQLAAVVNDSSGDENEDSACDDSKRRSLESITDALIAEPRASAEHEPSRECVRSTEPCAIGPTRHDER